MMALCCAPCALRPPLRRLVFLACFRSMGAGYVLFLLLSLGAASAEADRTARASTSGAVFDGSFIFVLAIVAVNVKFEYVPPSSFQFLGVRYRLTKKRDMQTLRIIVSSRCSCSTALVAGSAPTLPSSNFQSFGTMCWKFE